MREYAARLALLGLGLAAGFGAAEALARHLLPPPQRVTVRPAADTAPAHSADPQELTISGHMSELFMETRTGRRLRPNTHVTIEGDLIAHRHIELSTNSLGFRDKELGPKTSRRPRILFLGDSITMAYYLQEDETFVRLVEQLGREQGHDWETVNAGVPGVGTANELSILTETGLSVSPDVVVLNWFLNDFEASPGVRVRPLPGVIGWSHLLAQLMLTASTVAEAWFDRRPKHERLRLQRLKKEFVETHPTGRGDPRKDHAAFNAYVVKRFTDWGGAWSPGTWDYMRPLLASFQRLSVEKGFRLLIVAHPVRLQVEADFIDDYPQQRLADIARKLHVPVLDLLPPLRERCRAVASPLFYDHCHHTPEGSRFVAEQIVPFLEANP